MAATTWERNRVDKFQVFDGGWFNSAKTWDYVCIFTNTKSSLSSAIFRVRLQTETDPVSLGHLLTYLLQQPHTKLALPCHPFLTSTNNLLVQTSGKDCDQMKSKVVGTLRSLPLIFPIKYLMAVNGEIGIELFGINLIDCRLRHCLLLPCCWSVHPLFN